MDITKEYLKSTFKYIDGKLIWNRSREQYSNDGDYKRYMTRSHNKVAGSIKKTYSKHEREYWVVCLKAGLQRRRSRLIWIYHNGTIPEGMEIDHINRNSLDDRIENLRLVNSKENKKNRKQYKNNKLGEHNIHEIGVLYRVTISESFDTIEEAIAWRDKQT